MNLTEGEIYHVFFHFLVHANSNSIEIIKDGGFERQAFSQAIKQLLSSYTKAINKQEQRTGSLFQQKTQSNLCFWKPYRNSFPLHSSKPIKSEACK